MNHLVLSVGLDGSLREVIDGCELFAGCDESLLTDDIHIETGIIVILILIYTLFVLHMHLVRLVD